MSDPHPVDAIQQAKVTSAQYQTKHSYMEHAVFVGPYSEGIKVLDALHEEGWHITRSGPYTDKDMFPKMDMERFLFHAEREVDIAPAMKVVEAAKVVASLEAKERRLRKKYPPGSCNAEDAWSDFGKEQAAAWKAMRDALDTEAARAAKGGE